jgi:uncharacterized RDD family membrane protein YckC
MHQSLLDDLEHEKFKKAGFWLRLRATFLDLIILVIFSGFFAIFLSLICFVLSITTYYDVIWMFWGVLCFLYNPLMESSKSQGSLGKLVFNFKVIDKNGERLGFGHALIRFIAKILSFALFFAGFIMIGLSDKKEGLHDMIAKTSVISTQKE